ncbi:hypothetical protein ACHAXS_002353 [Conticribra weissflogii]
MIHAQGEECNICLSSFQVGDRAAWTKKGGCVHAFHEECISKWLLVREGCPMCRRSFLLGEREEGDGDGDNTADAGEAENGHSGPAEELYGMDDGYAAGNFDISNAAVRDLERGWGGTGIVAVEEEEEEKEEEDDDDDFEEEEKEEERGEKDKPAATAIATATVTTTSSSS